MPGELRFLVIDDSPHLRTLVSAYIRKAGYTNIATATTGAEGIEEYRKSRPDVVFLDVVMPVMDGLSALRAIRNDDPTALVVMVTSIASREAVVELKEAGAYSYILKPFEEAKFLEVLTKTVAFAAGDERKA